MGIDLNSIVGSIGNSLGQAGDAAGKMIKGASDGITQTLQNGIQVPEIQPADILNSAFQIPGIKISREEYLRKELGPMYPDEMVQKAIDETPAAAGVPAKALKKIADSCIGYETKKTTALSFAAGLPGGFAMAATIPADLAQYYGNLLRVLQKLAYLYGFKEFDLNQDQIRDETMTDLLILLGVMMGVNEANAAVKALCAAASNRAAKVIARKALTKTAYYPVIKKAAQVVGIKMTKDIFAKSVSKAIPVVGGVVSGGITYTTFKPGAERLRNSLITMTEEGEL